MRKAPKTGQARHFGTMTTSHENGEGWSGHDTYTSTEQNKRCVNQEKAHATPELALQLDRLNCQAEQNECT